MARSSPGEESKRDLLVAILGLTTGAVDATAFERLGHVFASVITGNLVLLGIGAEQTDGRLALFSACSLAAYALGVVVASPRHRMLPGEQRDGSLWPLGATQALVFDLVLLVVFAVIWEAIGSHPGEASKLVLLGLAAGAMGAQSSAIRRLGDFSTTYLTSTLVGMLEEIVARRWSPSTTRSLVVLVAVAIGAALATLVITHVRPALPVLVLLPLVVVIFTALLRFER
jgi:uncharacterized membrane protein YoaK (UPF0700 family)